MLQLEYVTVILSEPLTKLGIKQQADNVLNERKISRDGDGTVMSILEAMQLATPYIHMALKKEAVVVIVDKESRRIMSHLPGEHLDVGYKVGDLINEEDVNIKTGLRGENSDIYMSADVYGVPVNAKAFPIKEDGQVVGALAFGFPLAVQEKLGGYMDTVASIISSLQDKVHIIASHSEELAATSEEINQQSQLALEDSEKTYVVTDLIKNITRQTNLLGLNAAIEAARAGQHGAGFSIVAQEVRKLSTDTATATESISSSLHSITSNLQNLKESMTQISGASNEQALLVQDFSEIIENLSTLSKEMKDFMQKALK